MLNEIRPMRKRNHAIKNNALLRPRAAWKKGNCKWEVFQVVP
jgi:hypothetical protein